MIDRHFVQKMGTKSDTRTFSTVHRLPMVVLCSHTVLPRMMVYRLWSTSKPSLLESFLLNTGYDSSAKQRTDASES